MSAQRQIPLDLPRTPASIDSFGGLSDPVADRSTADFTAVLGLPIQHLYESFRSGTDAYLSRKDTPIGAAIWHDVVRLEESRERLSRVPPTEVPLTNPQQVFDVVRTVTGLDMLLNAYNHSQGTNYSIPATGDRGAPNVSLEMIRARFDPSPTPPVVEQAVCIQLLMLRVFADATTTFGCPQYTGGSSDVDQASTFSSETCGSYGVTTSISSLGFPIAGPLTLDRRGYEIDDLSSYFRRDGDEQSVDIQSISSGPLASPRSSMSSRSNPPPSIHSTMAKSMFSHDFEQEAAMASNKPSTAATATALTSLPPRALSHDASSVATNTPRRATHNRQASLVPRHIADYTHQYELRQAEQPDEGLGYGGLFVPPPIQQPSWTSRIILSITQALRLNGYTRFRSRTDQLLSSTQQTPPPPPTALEPIPEQPLTPLPFDSAPPGPLEQTRLQLTPGGGTRFDRHEYTSQPSPLHPSFGAFADTVAPQPQTPTPSPIVTPGSRDEPISSLFCRFIEARAGLAADAPLLRALFEHSADLAALSKLVEQFVEHRNAVAQGLYTGSHDVLPANRQGQEDTKDGNVMGLGGDDA